MLAIYSFLCSMCAGSNLVTAAEWAVINFEQPHTLRTLPVLLERGMAISYQGGVSRRSRRGL